MYICAVCAISQAKLFLLSKLFLMAMDGWGAYFNLKSKQNSESGLSASAWQTWILLFSLSLYSLYNRWGGRSVTRWGYIAQAQLALRDL